MTVRTQITRILLAASLAALPAAAGCARKVDFPGPPPPGTAPRLRIVSPTQGQAIAGLVVALRLDVQGFVLEPAGGASTPGRGHVDLRVDGGPAQSVSRDSVTVAFTAPGAHALTVELRLGDGSPLDPAVRDSVAFTLNVERTLSGDVQPIFTAHCAVPSCHTGPSPVLGEDLSTPDLSYATTVNVNSREVPSKSRVVPGDPTSSYTLSKVRGDAGIVGGRMPLGGPYLSAEEIQVIEEWIRAGAKKN